MNKITGILCAVIMVLECLPLCASASEQITVDSVPYETVGENLFEYPNFASGDTRIAEDCWYTGQNSGTSWDGNVPDVKTGENLTPLSEVLSGTGETEKGSSFYYAEDAGTSERSKYYLCENTTSANGAFWNGTNSLLGFVPIEAGKTYYFSYYQSAWGGDLKASVRCGAINAERFVNSDGSISWQDDLDHVGSYNGDNVEKVGWTKHETVIEAGEDADYFFFNLYWLQALDYVCVTDFELREIERLEVSEIEPASARVKAGAKAGAEARFPKTVTVVYKNGSTGTAVVKWDEFEATLDGEYEVKGVCTVGDTEYDAVCAVTVYSDSIDDNYTITKSFSDNDGIIETTVKVETAQSGRLLYVAAMYDAGCMTKAAAKYFDPTEEPEVTLSLTRTAGAEETVKTMIFDENLRPLSSCYAEGQEDEGGKFVSLQNVSITDGIFKDAQDVDLDYLLAIDVDKLLAPSFEMAGLDTPNGAVRYGGWERKSANNWGSSAETFTLAGHSLGHWMSAASVMYASTGNAELKERLDYAVQKLCELQEETGSGYIGGVDETCFKKLFAGNTSSWTDGYWVPWYGVHKIYQGLIDAYRETGNEGALTAAIKFADWAVEGTSNLTDSQMQTMLNVEYGGMNEVFAELYEITGNDEYMTAAIRFTHDAILTPLSEGKDELEGKHANTQIPKIIGAAAIADDNDEREDYETAAEFFWETVTKNRSYVIGGNSVAEHFKASGSEELHQKTCETCNTYNMIKLTERLFKQNHKSEYMDYVETALYNDILGAQDPTTGNKMYFTSLLQGHFRIYGDPENAWWCCTGTGMENPGRYGKCIYYKDGKELYVNLYIPSEMTWNETGLKIQMDTYFPYDDNVKLTISGSGEATLKFRAPSWLAGDMNVFVNGEETSAEAVDGYVSLTRAWKDGDVIDLTLPMGLLVYHAKDNENKVAFKYGPIVLAADLGDAGLPDDVETDETKIDLTTVSVPSIETGSEDAEDFIETVDLSTLTFKIAKENTSGEEDITLKPFYSIHHKFHNVYWYMNETAESYVKALNDITVDSVEPDGQQDEIGHNRQFKDSHQGTFTSDGTTYFYRDAYGSADAYFSYNLSISESGKTASCLYVSYWGGDVPFTADGVKYERKFNIYVDDTELAEVEINNPAAGQTYNVFYELPDSLTAGKTGITVKFAPVSATTCAGGVLGVRTTTGKLS